MDLYNNIEKIFLYENWILELNFHHFSEKLDIYTCSEIISFALTHFWDKNIKNINTSSKWNNGNKIKLIQQNLLELFCIQKLNDDFSNEINIFSNKNEFYASWEKILKKLWQIWLSDDTSYLLFSSLGEIIDNSFFHNLGRWTTKFWPKCFFYYHNNEQDKKLSFVISDLWVWIKGTLKNNFPNLKTEKDAINMALKPWITWRYEKKWWNWLVFLQKNIFNWFRWELFIRSNNFIAQIDWFAKMVEIKNDVKISWTMVMFDLFY